MAGRRSIVIKTDNPLSSPRGSYNPLDRMNIARSIESELLISPVDHLGAIDHIQGAGIYAIYYTGPSAIYRPIRNIRPDFKTPIYVGKAIPKGSRKGGLAISKGGGRALAERLKQHAASIEEIKNLNIKHFYVRHLPVDDIWIPLGENMLIERFKPVWNHAVDGFGNKAPGKRRKNQFRSPWDVLHPGRHFAAELGDNPVSAKFMADRVVAYLAGRDMAKLPRAVVEQQAIVDALVESDVI